MQLKRDHFLSLATSSSAVSELKLSNLYPFRFLAIISLQFVYQNYLVANLPFLPISNLIKMLV